MTGTAQFRKMALDFPGVSELPHFEKTSFRSGKKIFATLAEGEAKAVLKLSLIDQSVFCSFNSEIIYPVPGKWGKSGWTVFQLDKLRKEMVKDALSLAYAGLHAKTPPTKIRHL